MRSLANRPAREQNLLALMILLLFLAALGGGLWSVRSFAHGQAALLHEDRQELSQLRRQTRLATGLAEARAKLESLGEDGVSLLSGGTAALAGANLQSRINEIVSAAGGQLESSRLLPTEEEGKLQRIPVRVSGTMTVEALQKVVHRLETGQPLLFVDSLSGESPQGRRRQQNDAATRPELRVSLTVSGYIAVDEEGVEQ